MPCIIDVGTIIMQPTSERMIVNVGHVLAMVLHSAYIINTRPQPYSQIQQLCIVVRIHVLHITTRKPHLRIHDDAVTKLH